MVEFSFSDINIVDIEDKAIIEWVKDCLRPEDVFPESDLEDWAESNGFVKE